MKFKVRGLAVKEDGKTYPFRYNVKTKTLEGARKVAENLLSKKGEPAKIKEKSLIIEKWKPKKPMRRQGKDVEAFLTRPKGKMLEQLNEPLQPPRKHLIDGHLYVNIEDVINYIKRAR